MLRVQSLPNPQWIRVSLKCVSFAPTRAHSLSPFLTSDSMRVHFPKRLQRQWHNECRKGWPFERFAYLIGHRADLIEIEHLYIPADVAAHAGRKYVQTPSRWYFAALDEAAQEAAQVVGDIHSHPRSYRNWRGTTADATPSEGDFAAGWIGICGITVASEQRSGRIKCRTRFYPPAERVQIL